MFRPAKMNKLSIITLDEYSDNLISTLHEAGLVQIQDISEYIQEDIEWRQILKPAGLKSQTTDIISFLNRITSIVEFWKGVKKKKVSPVQLLKGFINPQIHEKIVIKELNQKEILEKAKVFLDEVEPGSKSIQNRLEEIESQNLKLETDLISAKNLVFLDFDVKDLRDSDHTFTITGKLGLEIYNNFMEELNEITDELIIFDCDSDEENKKTIIIISLNKYRENFIKLLRKFEFERFDISRLSGKPKNVMESIKIQIKDLKKEKSELINEADVISKKWMDKILTLKEQLEIERERNEIFSNFAKTDKTYMLEAWVLEKNVNKAIELIKISTEDHSIVDIKNPDGEENIPTHQENPTFAKPYEFLLNMFDSPNYKEIDPTIGIAIIFPFFFGFCLTDGFYGILDAIVGFILYRGLGRNSKTFRSFGVILIACGLWALILGLATNGFIGNLFPGYLGINLPTVIANFDAFVYPQNLLIIALICGIFQICLGLVIGAYNNLKKGAIGEAVGDQICWLIIIIGAVLLILSYVLGFGSIYIGASLVIIGIILNVYRNGLFGLMDVMGLVGTVFSYSRLLALCLSTGGIALAVNIVAFDVVTLIPVIGAILTPIVLVFGHSANAAIQSLGAFINSLRLHYVEYFSQFYEGGGKKFRPFLAKRKITTFD
jgi:V/A-type H+/Na+-transporting ATPase subunit I